MSANLITASTHLPAFMPHALSYIFLTVNVPIYAPISDTVPGLVYHLLSGLCFYITLSVRSLLIIPITRFNIHTNIVYVCLCLVLSKSL